MSSEKCDSGNSCQSCGSVQKCSQTDKETHETALIENRMNNIKHKFMVISGKGGVGKNFCFS